MMMLNRGLLMMTNTKFTKQEYILLMAALDNEQERYEITADWLFSRIPGYYDDVNLPKIKLFESIKQKLLLLEIDDEPAKFKGSTL
jgi:hypothetical protein